MKTARKTKSLRSAEPSLAAAAPVDVRAVAQMTPAASQTSHYAMMAPVRKKESIFWATLYLAAATVRMPVVTGVRKKLCVVASLMMARKKVATPRSNTPKTV